MKAALLNNRYRILKTLGRGGFGETYLTEDTHMPSRRKCVLKQLKPIVKQPKIPLWMKERFQREAAILEELGEGNSQIPRLYAYFSEDDKFYLVQEWIEGLTVDKYWEQEGNLHRDEVREILLQLLPVLDFVHSRRIVHRDIKPENIILQPEDRKPVLIDFGAVKEAMTTQVNPGSENDSEKMYSASIGTPGYMPSEQAAGRPVYSSDLYSLGLTAIFLLTGKAPHELETDPVNGEIIWHEYATNVDSELMSVLDKSIRFHPRDRFATAQEMLAALQPSSKTNSIASTTARVAPASKGSQRNSWRSGNQSHTVAVDVPYEQTLKKRSWLVNVALFVLIALGVGAGTFAAGFAVVSSLLRPSSQPVEKAKVEQPQRKPNIFIPSDRQQSAKKKAKAPNQSESEQADSSEEQELESAKTNPEEILLEEEDNNPPEVAISKEPKQAPESLPQPLPEAQPQPNSAIDVPIVTTGTSESQLVSTLGEPTSARPGWQENRRILVYQDVIPNRVNLTYQSDEGKIRQTDIALNQEVSLGTMQATLTKLLGGNAPAEVKEKLRSVYSRQTNFSFFRVGNLEGKVQRDSKDRVNISVWETGFE